MDIIQPSKEPAAAFEQKPTVSSGSSGSKQWIKINISLLVNLIGFDTRVILFRQAKRGDDR